MIVATRGRTCVPSGEWRRRGTDTTGAARCCRASPLGPRCCGQQTAWANRAAGDRNPAGGARILLDGRPAGESRLRSTASGRAAHRDHHTTNRIGASDGSHRGRPDGQARCADLLGLGRSLAPFVVECGGRRRVIGTTEEPRLRLSPGSTIDAHESRARVTARRSQSTSSPAKSSRSASIARHREPQRAAMGRGVDDGKKAATTPIANLQLSLGMREVIFRHPQFGERRVTITVKGQRDGGGQRRMSKPGSDHSVRGTRLRISVRATPASSVLLKKPRFCCNRT